MLASVDRKELIYLFTGSDRVSERKAVEHRSIQVTETIWLRGHMVGLIIRDPVLYQALNECSEDHMRLSKEEEKRDIR